MQVACVWEHNGNDTLLYAADFPGAYTRGENLEKAMAKMPAEVASYLQWAGKTIPREITLAVVQDAPCELQVCDADSEVLFDMEKAPLSMAEYAQLKALALKSAADFLELYASIPEKNRSGAPERKTFYGQVPRSAEAMYQHTKNVNAYYFGEIGVDADHEGTIWTCRQRGFVALEQKPGFLAMPAQKGSYGEYWSLRKMLRRFLWHDRIHAKAMYRMGTALFGAGNIKNPFCF